VRKAALLLATLSAEESAALLARLEAHQARAIAREMGRLDSIDAREQQGVMLEFVADGLRSRLRTRKASSQMSADSSGSPRFDFLQELGIDDLLACLQAEHPQTIALVVSRLSADRAAATTAGLPPDVARDVRRRMARMSACNDLALEDVAAGLREALSRLPREPAYPRISVLRSSSLDQAV
jgi:flagellar motor switch protein FliG